MLYSAVYSLLSFPLRPLLSTSRCPSPAFPLGFFLLAPFGFSFGGRAGLCPLLVVGLPLGAFFSLPPPVYAHFFLILYGRPTSLRLSSGSLVGFPFCTLFFLVFVRAVSRSDVPLTTYRFRILCLAWHPCLCFLLAPRSMVSHSPSLPHPCPGSTCFAGYSHWLPCSFLPSCRFLAVLLSFLLLLSFLPSAACLLPSFRAPPCSRPFCHARRFFSAMGGLGCALLALWGRRSHTPLLP